MPLEEIVAESVAGGNQALLWAQEESIPRTHARQTVVYLSKNLPLSFQGPASPHPVLEKVQFRKADTEAGVQSFRFI